MSQIKAHSETANESAGRAAANTAAGGDLGSAAGAAGGASSATHAGNNNQTKHQQTPTLSNQPEHQKQEQMSASNKLQEAHQQQANPALQDCPTMGAHNNSFGPNSQHIPDQRQSSSPPAKDLNQQQAKTNQQQHKPVGDATSWQSNQNGNTNADHQNRNSNSTNQNDLQQQQQHQQSVATTTSASSSTSSAALSLSTSSSSSSSSSTTTASPPSSISTSANRQQNQLQQHGGLSSQQAQAAYQQASLASRLDQVIRATLHDSPAAHIPKTSNSTSSAPSSLVFNSHLSGSAQSAHLSNTTTASSVTGLAPSSAATLSQLNSLCGAPTSAALSGGETSNSSGNSHLLAKTSAHSASHSVLQAAVALQSLNQSHLPRNPLAQQHQQQHLQQLTHSHLQHQPPSTLTNIGIGAPPATTKQISNPTPMPQAAHGASMSSFMPKLGITSTTSSDHYNHNHLALPGQQQQQQQQQHHHHSDNLTDLALKAAQQAGSGGNNNINDNNNKNHMSFLSNIRPPISWQDQMNVNQAIINNNSGAFRWQLPPNHDHPQQHPLISDNPTQQHQQANIFTTNIGKTNSPIGLNIGNNSDNMIGQDGDNLGRLNSSNRSDRQKHPANLPPQTSSSTYNLNDRGLGSLAGLSAHDMGSGPSSKAHSQPPLPPPWTDNNFKSPSLPSDVAANLRSQFQQHQQRISQEESERNTERLAMFAYNLMSSCIPGTNKPKQVIQLDDELRQSVYAGEFYSRFEHVALGILTNQVMVPGFSIIDYIRRDKFSYHEVEKIENVHKRLGPSNFLCLIELAQQRPPNFNNPTSMKDPAEFLRAASSDAFGNHMSASFGMPGGFPGVPSLAQQQQQQQLQNAKNSQFAYMTGLPGKPEHGMLCVDKSGRSSQSPSDNNFRSQTLTNNPQKLSSTHSSPMSSFHSALPNSPQLPPPPQTSGARSLASPAMSHYRSSSFQTPISINHQVVSRPPRSHSTIGGLGIGGPFKNNPNPFCTQQSPSQLRQPPAAHQNSSRPNLAALGAEVMPAHAHSGSLMSAHMASKSPQTPRLPDMIGSKPPGDGPLGPYQQKSPRYQPNLMPPGHLSPPPKINMDSMNRMTSHALRQQQIDMANRELAMRQMGMPQFVANQGLMNANSDLSRTGLMDANKSSKSPLNSQQQYGVVYGNPMGHQGINPPSFKSSPVCSNSSMMTQQHSDFSANRLNAMDPNKPLGFPGQGVPVTNDAQLKQYSALLAAYQQQQHQQHNSASTSPFNQSSSNNFNPLPQIHPNDLTDAQQLAFLQKPQISPKLANNQRSIITGSASTKKGKKSKLSPPIGAQQTNETKQQLGSSGCSSAGTFKPQVDVNDKYEFSNEASSLESESYQMSLNIQSRLSSVANESTTTSTYRDNFKPNSTVAHASPHMAPQTVNTFVGAHVSGAAGQNLSGAAHEIASNCNSDSGKNNDSNDNSVLFGTKQFECRETADLHHDALQHSNNTTELNTTKHSALSDQTDIKTTSTVTAPIDQQALPQVPKTNNNSDTSSAATNLQQPSQASKYQKLFTKKAWLKNYDLEDQTSQQSSQDTFDQQKQEKDNMVLRANNDNKTEKAASELDKDPEDSRTSPVLKSSIGLKVNKQQQKIKRDDADKDKKRTTEIKTKKSIQTSKTSRSATVPTAPGNKSGDNESDGTTATTSDTDETDASDDLKSSQDKKLRRMPKRKVKLASDRESDQPTSPKLKNLKDPSRKRDKKQKLASSETDSAKRKSNSDDETAVKQKAKKMKEAVVERPIEKTESPKNKKRIGEKFLQTEPCFEFEPKSIRCLECRRVRQTSSKGDKTIQQKQSRNSWDDFCRFFEFRKLRYNKVGHIVAAGFSDATDAKSNDKRLWLPGGTEVPKNINYEVAKYILSHVGDQFCKLVVQERTVQEQYIERMGDDKKITWKRAVNGLRELCDVCSTTLFNCHYVCERCGFVVCIDCYDTRDQIKIKLEKESSSIKDDPDKASNTSANGDDHSASNVAKKSKKDPQGWIYCAKNEEHLHEKLILTQIIAGDCLEEVSKLIHDTRERLNLGICWCKKMALGEHDDGDTKPARSTLKGLLLGNAGSQSNEDAENKLDNNIVENNNNHLSVIKQEPQDGDEVFGFANDDDSQDDSKQVSAAIEECIAALATKTSDEPIEETKFTTFDPAKPVSKHYSKLYDGDILVLNEPKCKDNLALFKEHWRTGKPVIVRGVHKQMDIETWWLPKFFAKQFGDYRSDLVDCRNGEIHRHSMKKYWEGFEPSPGSMKKRLKDDSLPSHIPTAPNEEPSAISTSYYTGSALWRLKDWPPGQDFKEELPEHYEDFMSNLPLRPYTTRAGKLNLACRLPKEMLKPDLGPKMYSAYGTPKFPERGTTNLHLDISDAVNVMVYVSGASAYTSGGSSEYKEIIDSIIDEYAADDQLKAQIREQNLIPGALWHIFKPSDTAKMREFLNKVSDERKISPEKRNDPIHDQIWYLDQTLLDRLKDEYGVQSYSILQCMGDAILVPAGAAHQVKNLQNCIKVANDFVSPENVHYCLQLTHEFRNLPETHMNQEDKLQIKNILYHSVKESLQYIKLFESNKVNPSDESEDGDEMATTQSDDDNIKKEVKA